MVIPKRTAVRLMWTPAAAVVESEVTAATQAGAGGSDGRDGDDGAGGDGGASDVGAEGDGSGLMVLLTCDV